MNTELTAVPTHLGLILDGNRRWAKKKGLPVTEGHRHGVETFREIVRAAHELGIKYVSAYVFSTENWSRSSQEVSYLMGLVVRVLEHDLMKLHKDNVKIVILGSRQGLEKRVADAIERAETKTANNTGITLCLCFNYGGKQEVLEAIQALIAQGIKPEDVTFKSIEDHLYGGDAVPPIDMIIRTSGEKRLSGFMLWRSEYAELFFDETLWPDYTVEKFKEAIEEYQTRHRRFGG